MKSLLVLIILVSLFCSGCSLFEDKRVRLVEPKLDMTSARYKETLSAIINNRYDSEYLRWIQADYAHQKDIEKKRQELLK